MQCREWLELWSGLVEGILPEWELRAIPFEYQPPHRDHSLWNRSGLWDFGHRNVVLKWILC
jgi:hypothetical protein